MSLVDLAPLNDILKRLEAVADRLEKTGVPSGAGGGSDDVPAVVVAFDAACAEKIAAMCTAAKDSQVAELVEASQSFKDAMDMLRQVLLASASCAKPKDDQWGPIMKPLQELASKRQAACDNRSPLFPNMKAMAEAVMAAGLFTAPGPPAHVQNVMESMDFHAIKVMQKKVDVETAWIKALKACLTALKTWTESDCKMGITWKAGGKDAAQYFAEKPLGQAAAAAPAAAAPAADSKGKGKGKGPPPPKPGQGAPPPKAPAAAAAAEPAGMAAVFSQIEAFSTAGLKTVTADMKTKNRPQDETSSVVPAAKSQPAKAPPSRSSGRGPKGPPVKELQKELNWVVENFEGVQDLTIEDVQIQHLVLFINCKNCTLRISSKVKSICIDSCEKVNLICQDVISTVELVNCERCQVQTTGVVNSFAIDKCNGVNCWLSKESIQAEFVTSKSSEMNVTYPDPDTEDGDPIEVPIPEQFVSTIKGKKLSTGVSKIYSG
mmetsp:Transcript_55033/g.101861  ORF Transcript_55033/g.101861 Transcript_55033/m.101861 type:complete len:490 (+) Transcript_55033:93-1562(+)